jgi:hypothetical protein
MGRKTTCKLWFHKYKLQEILSIWEIRYYKCVNCNKEYSKEYIELDDNY